MRWFLRSKITHAVVIEANLKYEGSITIDEELLGKSGAFQAEEWAESEKLENSCRRGFLRSTANGHAVKAWIRSARWGRLSLPAMKSPIRRTST